MRPPDFNDLHIRGSDSLLGEPLVWDSGVTTIILSFNCERYLGQAIESALMQQLERPHQVWIHDDASTDSSPEIIRSYVRKYPSSVVGILRSVNLFSQGVRIRNSVYRHVTKGYIASLDGDDYWTDPLKLAKQSDALDHNRGAALSAHSWRRVTEAGDYIDTITLPGFRRSIEFQSFALSNPLCSATTLIRASSFQRLPSFSAEAPISQDWELWARLSLVGSVVTTPEVMADFRFYMSQTALTTAPELVQDHDRVQRLLYGDASGLNRIRWRAAMTARQVVERQRSRNPRLSRGIETASKVALEASAGNIRLGRRRGRPEDLHEPAVAE